MQSTSGSKSLFGHFWKSIFLLALLTIGSLAAADKIPNAPESSTDKHLHFLAYATLTFVVLLDGYEFFISRLSIKTGRWMILSVAFCCLWGTLMEVGQGLLPTNRNMEVLDIVANTLGSLIGMGLYSLICKKKIFQ